MEDKDHTTSPWWERPLVVGGAAVVLATVVIVLGVLAATLTSHGARHGPNDSRVCSEARHVLRVVQQPLQSGDIQGTIQAAQVVRPEAISLSNQSGLSRGVRAALRNLADALEATANGSAASIPRADRQLAAAC
ncbi:MAG TPA: hypothetical protein VG476_05590 [Acidimicrobiales bacterium]|nr:hypothetical protein [Acidimicrobiales bacterium]